MAAPMLGDVLCPVVVRARGGCVPGGAVACGGLVDLAVAWVAGGTMAVTPSVRSRAGVISHFDRPVPAPAGPVPDARGRSRGWRGRWAAIGAAVAVVAGTGGVVFPGAANAQVTPSQTASNLNYVAGQAPTPNQVTVALGATGQVSFFASGGPVNVIADVAGYTTAARLTNPQLAQNQWDQDLARPATDRRRHHPDRCGVRWHQHLGHHLQLQQREAHQRHDGCRRRRTIVVGPRPVGVAFDGTNIWVTIAGSNYVKRINAATGVVVGAPIPVGLGPVGVAFDGTNIWVTNVGSNNVTRINAATGAVVGAPIAVGGTGPQGVAFDGTNIWVTNTGSNNVTRINAATGAVVGAPITVGAAPLGVAFDGTNIWVANTGSNYVTRINAATGAVGAPITVGLGPAGVAFDGTNIWVTNAGSNNVTRIKAATGTVVGDPIAVGTAPVGVTFDGTNIWVTNQNSNNVTRINAATGTVVGAPIAVGANPVGVTFDGTNIWVANAGSNNVTKLRTG
ncbi:MAG: YncE family protein [Actinobacteria bacterium]|nr:YncE family protein [Actinomycetota bacterium]